MHSAMRNQDLDLPPSYVEATGNPPYPLGMDDIPRPRVPLALTQTIASDSQAENSTIQGSMPIGWAPYTKDETEFEQWDDASTKILITRRLEMNDKFEKATTALEKESLWNIILQELIEKGFTHFRVIDLIKYWELKLYIYKTMRNDPDAHKNSDWEYYEAMQNTFKDKNSSIFALDTDPLPGTSTALVDRLIAARPYTEPRADSVIDLDSIASPIPGVEQVKNLADTSVPSAPTISSEATPFTDISSSTNNMNLNESVTSQPRSTLPTLRNDVITSQPTSVYNGTTRPYQNGNRFSYDDDDDCCCCCCFSSSNQTNNDDCCNDFCFGGQYGHSANNRRGYSEDYGQRSMLYEMTTHHNNYEINNFDDGSTRNDDDTGIGIGSIDCGNIETGGNDCCPSNGTGGESHDCGDSGTNYGGGDTGTCDYSDSGCGGGGGDSGGGCDY